MIKNKQPEKFYGDEAPSIKHFLIILGVLAALTALSWIAFYKLHWFH